jgi:hypothetical protein
MAYSRREGLFLTLGEPVGKPVPLGHRRPARMEESFGRKFQNIYVSRNFLSRRSQVFCESILCAVLISVISI